MKACDCTGDTCVCVDFVDQKDVPGKGLFTASVCVDASVDASKKNIGFNCIIHTKC